MRAVANDLGLPRYTVPRPPRVFLLEHPHRRGASGTYRPSSRTIHIYETSRIFEEGLFTVTLVHELVHAAEHGLTGHLIPVRDTLDYWLGNPTEGRARRLSAALEIRLQLDIEDRLALGYKGH